MKTLRFMIVFLSIYFVVPVAFDLEPSLIQSAGITFLLLVIRTALLEGITVDASPFLTWEIVSDENEVEEEREDD